MKNLANARVGCAMTGSFCTFSAAFDAFRALKSAGCDIVPIMSENAYSVDTRFYCAADARETFREIAGRDIIHTISQAEPIGPRALLDLLVVAPCTGNTLAKLACGIADTSVTLAVKSHVRNARPVLIAISTNDALSRNAASIGALMAQKHMFFAPYAQDDYAGKPASLVARLETLAEAASLALEGRQIQPLIVTQM